MSLTRGEIVGYDAKRMVYKFFMNDGVNIIDCEISGPALDALVGRETFKHSSRDAQFLTFRDLIERMASDQFEQNGTSPVRIFAKHIPRDKEN